MHCRQIVSIIICIEIIIIYDNDQDFLLLLPDFFYFAVIFYSDKLRGSFVGVVSVYEKTVSRRIKPIQNVDKRVVSI